jgi:3-oxoacyl-[acyl-carrier protein] reductase
VNDQNSRPGRVAIVTGAFGGIGRGIVDELRADGVAVVAVDRAVPDDIVEDGTLHALARDITDVDAGEAIVAAALERFGRVDVIVHCAGVLRDGLVGKLTEDDVRFVLGVNLTSALRLTDAALPHLRRSGSGRVVSISSRAWLGVRGSSNYSASKGGLVGMTRALALAEGANGITANAVAPGFIATPLSAHLSERVIAGIPVGRAGTPRDVARAVAFFASADAGYVTGQTLLVCGGRGLRP